jgi:hypothetical protein
MRIGEKRKKVATTISRRLPCFLLMVGTTVSIARTMKSSRDNGRVSRVSPGNLFLAEVLGELLFPASCGRTALNSILVMTWAPFSI